MICGIVMAGGQGRRLRPFINQLRPNSLPKQFINVIGKRSMLEHTFFRGEKVIPPERLFAIVTQDHPRYPEVRRSLLAARAVR